MTFKRTDHGISNYPMFYNADLIIYTEGKTLDNINANQVVPDCTFFYSIFSNLIPHRKVKVKAVGNKLNAYSYAESIKASGDNNSFVIVDRDHDGILNPPSAKEKVIFTDGYSWENDLWNEQLIYNLIQTMSFNNDTVLKDFKYLVKNTVKRIKYLSVLDILCQKISQTILVKTSALRGISLKENSKFPVSRVDISRLSRKFRTYYSDITDHKAFLIACSKIAYNKLIQGHFWKNLVTKLLGCVYMNCHGDSRPSDKSLLLLAIQELKNNTLAYQDLLTYYKSQLQNLSLNI